MNNPGIPPASSSTMAPSTSHSPSTVQISPSHGHSMHSMPPPKKSLERKMGILRADSGIAIKPDTKSAITNPDQLNSSFSALPKEDPTNIITTDTPGATSTFSMTDITNTISKLDQLNTHLRAILTPIPDTPIAYLDDSTSTCEFSTGEKTPYTSAGENEQEDPFDAFADTTGATVANDMSGTISEIDQILDQISAIRYVTSTMSSSLDEFLLKDSIIPKINIEKEKEKERTSIPPTISSDLPSASRLPSSPSTEHIEHDALILKWVDKLSPAQKWRFRRKPISASLRRKIHRMKRRKEKEEQTPIPPNLLSPHLPPASPSAEQAPIQPLLPTTPITSSSLPPSSPSAERIDRRARIRQWLSNLPPPQESSHTGYRALAASLSLQRRIKLVNEQSKGELPFTPTSNVLDPYYWNPKDALAFACTLSSEPAKTPIPALPKEEEEAAEPILAGPYNEPSMSRPSTSKPWICRPLKKEATGESTSAGEAKEGEKETGKEKGEEEKTPKLFITRMVVFAPGQSMESVLRSIRAGEKEKEKQSNQQPQQTQQTKSAD